MRSILLIASIGLGLGLGACAGEPVTTVTDAKTGICMKTFRDNGTGLPDTRNTGYLFMQGCDQARVIAAGATSQPSVAEGLAAAVVSGGLTAGGTVAGAKLLGQGIRGASIKLVVP